MYIPGPYQVNESGRLASFLRRHSFATLITHDGMAPFASHLPMLLQEGGEHGMLLSHMARANPQWKHFASGAEVLVIFHGPHGYVSPSWYETTPAVPTWNYAVVHAYGVPTVFSDHSKVSSLLDETVSFYESALDQPWSGELPAEFRDRLMNAIVAFEIPISRLEGKFKLSQNRPSADAEGVIQALSRSPAADDRALAEFMRTEANPALRQASSLRSGPSS
jgi:transcriptional regulator